MDELEISGKRYISTRRAAKERNYHSDYIGQLIRGKKVEGQKVGRSWYVAADSLDEYFSNEGGSKLTPKAAPKVVPKVIKVVPEEVKATLPATEVEEEVSEDSTKVESIEALEKEQEPAELISVSVPQTVVSELPEEVEEEISIPIRKPQSTKEIPAIKSKSTLRYIADDTPLYPRAQQHSVPQIKIRSTVMPHVVKEIAEETVYVEEEPVMIIERPKKRKSANQIALRVGAVLVVGAITAGITAFASSYIISTTTVEGDTANVSYSLGGIE